MKPSYSEQLRRYIKLVRDRQFTIPAARRALISEIANRVQARKASTDNAVRLIFICTHNSRRSHFADVWCTIALSHFSVEGFLSGSGGTEITACNERTVASLQRAGLQISKESSDENPIYHVVYSDHYEPIHCLSKIYNQPPNPGSDFVALLCCSEVDEQCPVITGASDRFSLHYDDPKISDGTNAEEQTYDERCLQIATEMFCLAELISGGKTIVAESR